MCLPVVTRFLCPPEIPLIISSPTIVSAQTSNPKIYNILHIFIRTLKQKYFYIFIIFLN